MHRNLGSGLFDQNQKMTVAAMQMAKKKVWAHLLQWVEMRRSSPMSVLDQMTVALFKFTNKKNLFTENKNEK